MGYFEFVRQTRSCCRMLSRARSAGLSPSLQLHVAFEWSMLAFDVSGMSWRVCMAGAEFVKPVVQTMVRQLESGPQPCVARFIGLGCECIDIRDRAFDLCQDRHGVGLGEDGLAPNFYMHCTGMRRNVGGAPGNTAPHAD